jgi:phospholipase/lecithinase/hemolysin
MQANLKQAGTDLATQAKRLVAAGATHVVVVSAYDMSKTPWAAATGRQVDLAAASTAFNNGVELALADQGANMLFIDTAFEFNLIVNSPGSFNLTNSTNAACTSVDPGPGIGIGTGQVNSLLCTPSTIVPGFDYNQFAFADLVYPAPQAQRTFGAYVFSRITARW